MRFFFSHRQADISHSFYGKGTFAGCSLKVDDLLRHQFPEIPEISQELKNFFVAALNG
jgi:hypothetical protein